MDQVIPPSMQPVLQNTKQPIWTKFWFTWLVLTTSYIILFVFSNALDDKNALSRVGAALGLFVPVGLWTGSWGLIGLFNFSAGYGRNIFGFGG